MSTHRFRRLLGGASVSLALAATSGSVAVATGAHAPVPLAVRVVGNHLVNANGSVLRLLGVDRAGTEYQCMRSTQVFQGPTDVGSVAAIASWHVDAVRLPLNEDCWLGINGARRGAAGAAYRAAIVQYVGLLEARRIYVILDLHWAAPSGYPATTQWPMPDTDHAPAFWASVASTFRSNHGVLFDLFNEPYVESWSCWRAGCPATFVRRGQRIRYRAAGMQLLVDVVRSTGARNPILLGGIFWANDVADWLRYEPHDPASQLVASFHTYNFSGCSSVACWNANVAPLATRVPVVTGEFGESGCKDSFALRYMAWADAHGVSYLGWAWNATGAPSYWSCSAGPALIVNYDGAPTHYGIGLRHHLAQLHASSSTSPAAPRA